MRLDVCFEIEARLLASCFVEEQGQFAASLADIMQEHPTLSSCPGCVGHGILPEILSSKEAAM